MLAGLTDRSWLWIAAACYLAGLVSGTVSILRGQRQSGPAINAFIVAGYVLQLVGLGLRGQAVRGCPLGNSFELFQFTAWSAITLYFVIGVTFRSSMLGYFTSSLAAALTLVSLSIPAWDATRRSGIFGGNPWIELHAALALFSYGVFALLALTSVMTLLRHHSLKSKRLGGWFSFLPSIMDLDHISVRLLWAGVILMSAALAMGANYWLRNTSLVHLPKLFMTLSVWAAYAITLGLRLRGLLISKRFAWACVAMFGVALFSLWPVNNNHQPAARPPAALP
jgi:ABC-type uncharacterized transport system permease subunit